MDTVLRRTEPDVVEATLSRLPAASALPLLNNLAERLERRPRDAPRLVPWIQATLRHHAAHLANHPGARDALARLQHVVAERVHLLPKLLALQGKFDLLLRRAAAAKVPIVFAEYDGGGSDTFAALQRMVRADPVPPSAALLPSPESEHRRLNELEGDEMLESDVEEPAGPVEPEPGAWIAAADSASSSCFVRAWTFSGGSDEEPPACWKVGYWCMVGDIC